MLLNLAVTHSVNVWIKKPNTAKPKLSAVILSCNLSNLTLVKHIKKAANAAFNLIISMMAGDAKSV